MSEERRKVIEVRDLSYSYKTDKALDNATFDVYEKSIHGFVGPNGAGKTTVLKIISTLLKPQYGIARVYDRDVYHEYKEIRRRIGFMPDHFSMYRQMTVFEYLDFFAAAYGMSLSQRDQTIKDVLALTDMGGRQDSLIQGLSTGMKQRVSLARVLVHDPDLLLLDEPAAGLDPRARIELMDILQELRRLGKTIFISSHILSELADLCDSVTIIDRGYVKYTGSMQGLLTQSEEEDMRHYVINLAEPVDQMEEALSRLEGIHHFSQTADMPEYKFTYNKTQLDLNEIIQKTLSTGGSIVNVKEDVKHLNQAFMDLTRPGVRT